MKCTIFFAGLCTILTASEAVLYLPKPVDLAPVVPKPAIVPELTVPKPANQKPGVSSKTAEDMRSLEKLFDAYDAYDKVREFIEAVQNNDNSNNQCAQLETRIGSCLHSNVPSTAEAEAAEAMACICKLRSTMLSTRLPSTDGDIFSKCGSSVVKKYESACSASKMARTAAQQQSPEDDSSDWISFNESKAGSSGRTGSSSGRTHGGDPANGAGYKAVISCELSTFVSLMVTLFLLVLL